MTINSNPSYLARLPENLVPAGPGLRCDITGAAQTMVSWPTTSVTHVLLVGEALAGTAAGVFRWTVGGETPTTTSGAVCSGGVWARPLISVDAWNALKCVQVHNTGTFYAIPFKAS